MRNYLSFEDGFLEAYTAEQVESAIAYGMQENFRERLRELMERYNSQDVDRVQSMMAKARERERERENCHVSLVFGLMFLWSPLRVFS